MSVNAFLRESVTISPAVCLQKTRTRSRRALFACSCALCVSGVWIRGWKRDNAGQQRKLTVKPNHLQNHQSSTGIKTCSVHCCGRPLLAAYIPRSKRSKWTMGSMRSHWVSLRRIIVVEMFASSPPTAGARLLDDIIWQRLLSSQWLACVLDAAPWEFGAARF